MDRLEDLVSDLKAVSDPVERRKAAFTVVRNIPYQPAGPHQEPLDVLGQNYGNCRGKAGLLSLLLTRLGYTTRILKIRYKLRDDIPEVQFIPGRSDTALAERPLRTKIDGKPDLDFDNEYAQWDRQLEQAYQAHSVQIDEYSFKYNEVLKAARVKRG